MNYDDFRDTHTMIYNEKEYGVLLNVHMYKDKDTRELMASVEVYDNDDHQLHRFNDNVEKFKFLPKVMYAKNIL